MHRMMSILFVVMLAIAGSTVFAPRSEASPLIPAAPLAQAVGADTVTLAHYRYWHHRHYGWYHRRHYGYYHRPYYRHYGYYHRPYYRHYGYYHRRWYY